MAGLRELLKKSPLAGWLLLALLVAIAALLISKRLGSGLRPAAQPTPGRVVEAPVATLPPAPGARPGAPTQGSPPTPGARVTPPGGSPSAPPGVRPSPPAVGQAPVPAPAPKPGGSSVVGIGPVGRADPFFPLVRPGGPGTGRGEPPPPSFVTLPPPPLPGAGTPLGVQGPGTPTTQTGIAVTGLVSDTGAVVVIVAGGRTEILSEGEAIGDLRVLKIDADRRLVTFSRAGTRFDVRMGGE